MFGNQFFSEYQTKLVVYDTLHRKLGEADGLHHAMMLMIHDLKKNSLFRKWYIIYEGVMASNKEPIWFGDLAEIEKYAESHSDLIAQRELIQLRTKMTTNHHVLMKSLSNSHPYLAHLSSIPESDVESDTDSELSRFGCTVL